MTKIHCFDDIYIKLLLPEDVTEEYVSWINDSETNKYLVTQKTSLNECKKYVLNKYKDNNTVFYGIYHNERHIGNIKIEKIDNKLKCGCLGIMIGNKNYRSKGYGTKIINFFCKYSFDTLNLNLILLGVLKENIRAIKCYLKCGYKEIKNINLVNSKIVNDYLIKYKFINDDERIYMILVK